DPMRFCPEALKQRFGVTRVLGTGGMGAVFQGAMPGTGKPCALKVIFGNPGKSAAARLVQEAQLMGRFRHPHLIEVYDTGFEDGSPWLAMELVEGGDLKDRARELGGRLPPDEVEQVVRDVAGVFTALHAQGILHRDIKPQNILVTAKGKPKVTDFGIAQAVDSQSFT
ncbi:MAG: serine/threonine protein kinase, partial [Myxococcales bacterium]|nr:serine/threonine protein kinase [Myxococcales bacterium]